MKLRFASAVPPNVAGIAALVVAVLSCASLDASAQTLVGTVSYAESGQPVAAALVEAESETGTRIGGMTRLDGGFVLSLGTAGRWRVSVRRIGAQTLTTEWETVGDDDVRRMDLRLEVAVISLDPIGVSVESRCDLRDAPDRDGAVFALWEEAQKALEIARWGEENRLVRFTTRSFRRFVDLKDGSRSTEASSVRRAVAAHTFTSLPAQDLSDSGYVRVVEGSSTWYGPDLEVLLSDQFLADHCFRTHREGDRVGLRFEPIKDRSVPDIQGTIWFQPGGAVLDAVEFSYTGVPGLDRNGPVGGTIDFDFLPTGWWYVRSWELRLPHFGVDVRSASRVILGLTEVGGEASGVEVRSPRVVIAAGGVGAVEGTIRTADGATTRTRIRLEPSGAMGFADDSGRFRVDALRVGLYRMVVDHPLAQAAPMPGFSEVQVSISSGSTTSVEIELPSAVSVVDATCGGREPGIGAIVGMVRHRSDGRHVEGGAVTANAILSRPEQVRVQEGYTSEINEGGAFVLCYVRPFLPVRVSVIDAAGNSDLFEVRALGEGELRVVEWVVALR